MTRPEPSFAILLSCFVLLWLGAGLLVFDYPLHVMGLPVFAGLFTVAMCITIVATNLKTEANSSYPAPAPGRIDKPRLIRFLCLTSILPIAHLLGYALGLPVFLALYLASTGLSWPRCLIAAVICALLIEIVFVRLLKVSLPMLWGA